MWCASRLMETAVLPFSGQAHLDLPCKASIRFQTEAAIESFVCYAVHFKVTTSWGQFLNFIFLKLNIFWTIKRLLRKKICVINFFKICHAKKLQHFPYLAHLKTQNQLSRNAEFCLKNSSTVDNFLLNISTQSCTQYNKGEIQHKVYL